MVYLQWSNRAIFPELLYSIYIPVYTFIGVIAVKTAKVIPNGGSQAVRLPKEYRFDADEVLVNKIGDVVTLVPQDANRASLIMSGIEMFTDDFMRDVEPLHMENKDLF